MSNVYNKLFVNSDEVFTKEEVLQLQEELLEIYGYKPLPPMYSLLAQNVYYNSLPKEFSEKSKKRKLYTTEGTLIASGYTRIVIGDYGAFVEISNEQIKKDKIVVKHGEEYRINEERYSKNTKYHWLTVQDGSLVKIYYQQKTVDYADYKVGYYYISPYELSFEKKEGRGSF